MSKNVKLQMTTFSLISLSAHHLLIFTFSHYLLYSVTHSLLLLVFLYFSLFLFFSPLFFFLASHYLYKVSLHSAFLNSKNSYPTSQCYSATKATDFCIGFYIYVFTTIIIKFNSDADILCLKF